jgi:hypothetical protein
MVVVGAVAAAGVCVAMVIAGAAELAADESSLGAPATVAMLVFFACIGFGLLRLAWGAAGRERARRIARRRVAVDAVAPLLDPNGRLTVAVLDGPGVLRVLLLWLRGHPRDADVLEARVVAERQVPRDEPARAEDAVVALSEVAMLVTRVRTDARDVEGAAGAIAVVTGGEDADALLLAAALVGAFAAGLLVCARRWTAIELR